MKECILSAIIGYILGMFLTAEPVAWFYTKKHISQIGTGNPGMANVMAQIGKKAGFTVLIGDILKTLIAMGVSYLLFRKMIGWDAVLYSGMGAIFGHNFPAWRKFKGGKGVTVTVTWLVIALPVWGAAVSIVGGLITIWTGYLPLGAILIPLFALPFAFLTDGVKTGIFVLISLLIMISRHYRGMIRIFQGVEKREFRKKEEVSETAENTEQPSFEDVVEESLRSQQTKEQ